MTMNTSLVVTLFLYWHSVQQTFSPHTGRGSCQLLILAIRSGKLNDSSANVFNWKKNSSVNFDVRSNHWSNMTFHQEPEEPMSACLCLYDVRVCWWTPRQRRRRGHWGRWRSRSPHGDYVTCNGNGVMVQWYNGVIEWTLKSSEA